MPFFRMDVLLTTRRLEDSGYKQFAECLVSSSLCSINGSTAPPCHYVSLYMQGIYVYSGGQKKSNDASPELDHSPDNGAWIATSQNSRDNAILSPGKEPDNQWKFCRGFVSLQLAVKTLLINDCKARCAISRQCHLSLNEYVLKYNRVVHLRYSRDNNKVQGPPIVHRYSPLSMKKYPKHPVKVRGQNTVTASSIQTNGNAKSSRKASPAHSSL